MYLMSPTCAVAGARAGSVQRAEHGVAKQALRTKASRPHRRDPGASILTPETIWDVAEPEIPLWVGRMGGFAVVKVPYASAGQGVWTITHEEELQEFMALEHRSDRFIVQVGFRRDLLKHEH